MAVFVYSRIVGPVFIRVVILHKYEHTERKTALIPREIHYIRIAEFFVSSPLQPADKKNKCADEINAESPRPLNYIKQGFIDIKQLHYYSPKKIYNEIITDIKNTVKRQHKSFN